MVRKNYANHTSFKIGEVADILGIGMSTAKRYIDKGIIKGRRMEIGGQRVVMRKSLMDYVRKHDIDVDIAGHDWQILVVSHQLKFINPFQDRLGDHVIAAESIFEAGAMFNQYEPEFAAIDFRIEEAFQISKELKARKVKVVGVRPSKGDGGMNFSCCKSSIQLTGYNALPGVVEVITKNFIRKVV